jgi:type II secretory pathway predicted ATPase ExeA
MYEQFYGLKEKPFQIVPNPSYLFLSSVHENALTYLEYGLMENVGFILLTGEIGTGKTTLVRHIMEQFESEKEIAVIFNTNVTVDELMCLILRSFELEPEVGNKTKNLEKFNQFLIEKYAENKHVLLIIDEAQNLSDEALEEVRMFSNLQSDDQNLIQIMLVGQPELKVRLQQPGQNPFAQRIAVNFFLPGLTEKETHSYIDYRLEKAGGKNNIFSQEAKYMVYQASGGIPRSINLLCDSALVYGFGYELKTINAKVVGQVIKDKGGMGINEKTENLKTFLSSSSEKEESNKDLDRFQHLEDVVQLLQRQVDYMFEMTQAMKEERESVKVNQNGNIKKLLLQERKRNDELLAAYCQLKLKHNQLLKERDNDLSKLEKMVTEKFVKDALGKWLKHIGNGP